MYKQLKTLRLNLDNQGEIHPIHSHMLQNRQSHTQSLHTQSEWQGARRPFPQGHFRYRNTRVKGLRYDLVSVAGQPEAPQRPLLYTKSHMSAAPQSAREDRAQGHNLLGRHNGSPALVSVREGRQSCNSLELHAHLFHGSSSHVLLILQDEV